MKEEHFTYEVRGPIALIGFDRAEKRNAISDGVIDQLEAVVRRASAESKVGVIYGHGRHFSAGLDLVEFARKSPTESLFGSQRWHAVFDQIQRGRIPFVAALHGAVIGGGLELAASTHLRVADETAFFALPEGQRGIFVGGGGSVRIARMMTAARMTDLMLTGRTLDVVEAERFSLVNYVVPPGKALDKACELADKIAKNAPLSNYAITNALPRIQDLSQENGLFVESLLSSYTQGSPEAIERLEMFVNKQSERVAPPSIRSGNKETVSR
ncbi:crotonase/enoyl-CoA hydratase family protein [Bradyrhizobium sp. CCGB12]|uniref:crotonase/enoyl-CoA hydratase family protein n=1 Tax=Bradyrhizobium sp. CCGB12 TaxID=2949632 RepID=UPI0020B35C1A|nr:crotonase/enoyl-CoA hydratase family protein [Bradyrhizobium sp. CCGB12]MCP3387845.1 crotonase/enoyl-CoA hydratase family protein [Bradyrhizobium sp. CCGB12]